MEGRSSSSQQKLYHIHYKNEKNIIVGLPVYPHRNPIPAGHQLLISFLLAMDRYRCDGCMVCADYYQTHDQGVTTLKLSFESKEELAAFIATEIINTSEALEILGGSRQNLNSFVKRGKLHPIKEMVRDRLFFKSDVLERKADASRYNRQLD